MSIVEEYMFKHPHEIMKLEDEYIELILMSLQEERKHWIRNYSRCHNEYVNLKQENTKLKERIDSTIDFIHIYTNGINLEAFDCLKLMYKIEEILKDSDVK